jgi:serine/threonine protein kinase
MWRAMPLEETFPTLEDDGIELMQLMMTYDPAKRISARMALEHAYFYNKE